jgi:thiamine pyrophosphate-dependent acetolactate synthase large subunit-like protein
MTPPTAPVLLVLDTELQDRPIPPHEKLVIPKLPKIAPLIGDPGAVGEAAQLLVDGASPVIVADRCARSQAGIDRLVDLAEILQCAVGSRLWDMKKHYHHTGPAGGGGIGYGAPAAAGAALANKKHGRLTLTIQGDGDLMYSPSVLWTCAHSRLPVLYVITTTVPITRRSWACHAWRTAASAASIEPISAAPWMILSSTTRPLPRVSAWPRSGRSPIPTTSVRC